MKTKVKEIEIDGRKYSKLYYGMICEITDYGTIEVMEEEDEDLYREIEKKLSE